MITSSDVEPISVQGAQFVDVGGLDEISPLGNLELALSLQMSSISLDELRSGDVLDGDGLLGDFRGHN